MQYIALIGLIGIPILIVLILWRGRGTGALPPFYTTLFFAGCAIGSTWEIGFSLLSMDQLAEPLSYAIEPGGARAENIDRGEGFAWFHIVIVLPLVCIWDAGLLLCGIWLSNRAGFRPSFARFRWGELGILMLWGQLQSFAIEMIAIELGIWAYNMTSYNPALFSYGDSQITALPQIVWLIACPVFYLIGLRSKANSNMN